MEKLTCDKPYNLDEARKKNDLPRRRRKDPRTTAYELVIRIPQEYREAFNGKKKVTRTVFALNKREHLRQLVSDFETEQNEYLASRLDEFGLSPEEVSGYDFGCMPFKRYARRYIERRSHGSVSKQTIKNEERYLEYAQATIGDIPIKELTAEDIERAVLAVPRLSEEWALKKREEQEKKRARTSYTISHRKPKPFGPLRVAGPATQQKVLKFIRELLNDAVDREHISRNVAKKKFLSKNFKKPRPLIDPLMEGDADRFLRCVAELPLICLKVALLLLFSTGMRPEEMLALRVGCFVFSESDDADTEVRIIARLNEGVVEPYTKSDSSMRTVPVDRYTASVVKAWIELKRQYLLELGIRLTDSTMLLGETADVWRYNPFHLQWEKFIKKNGFEGTRPYALRHTFATLNLIRGENIKTISALLGHADASYTLDLYVGFIPSTTRGLANRYVGRFLPDLVELPKAA